MADVDLANHVNQYWPILKSRLRACGYHSQAVRSIEIPKPRVGTRQPDIPCVVDYLIQQALLQQLTPLLPTVFKLHLEFSPEQKRPSSRQDSPCPWGIRVPVVCGNRCGEFFGRVNHDILMACVERRIEDKRVLRLPSRDL